MVRVCTVGPLAGGLHPHQPVDVGQLPAPCKHSITWADIPCHLSPVPPVQARTWPPCWQEVAPLGPVRQKVAGTVPCCREGWRPCSQATLLVPQPSHPGADWLSPIRTPADPL